nr:DUF6402 family protein [Burkholderia ambifaria]
MGIPLKGPRIHDPSTWATGAKTGSTVANLYEPGKVYYPVRNRSFRDWQARHHRGGDFIIFSDYKPIMLDKPITVYFE